LSCLSQQKMSAPNKISKNQLDSALKKVLDHANDPKTKRKFTESIELQIRLKNYDAKKDKRINVTFRLPHTPRPNLKFAVVADGKHIEEATAAKVDFIDIEGLKKFNKNKKEIRKWVHKYDELVASPEMIKQIPRIIGPVLNKMDRFPASLNLKDPLTAQIEELKGTVKFQLKKEMGMNVAIGNITQKPEEIEQNINVAINNFVGQLKKGWHNIRSVHIKSSMGPPQQLF